MPLVLVDNLAPRRFRFAAMLCSMAAFCAAAGAVTLRQQWTPGQQLGYETTLTGAMTLLADDESPQPWAGLPTDFRVRGNSSLALETLAADAAGVGTVALRVGDSRVRAQGFGQIFEVTIRDGQVTALTNGKPAESPKAMRAVAEPDWAMHLTPDGRLAGVIALKVPPQTPPEAARKPLGAADTPFDLASAAQSWMLRAFPALWPPGEVKIGESWTMPIAVPLPPARPKANETAPPPLPPLRIGDATFTLRGEEEIAGRKAQRVALSGAFDIDAAKAKIIGDATRAASPETAPVAPPKKNVPSTTLDLADAKQKFTGDLWLDTASGQLVRAELAMQIHAHSTGVIKNKAGRTRPTEDWADFDGTLQMQLRKVSYESAQGVKK